MKENPVKRTLKSGGVAVGTMIFEFNTPGIARLAATAGAEFIIFDMEHTGWSVETIRTLFATTPGDALVPMVRVPATEYHFVARVLDVGARGIMVPMVSSREQAERIVRYAKYPPAGRRGAAFGVAHDDYDSSDIHATMRQANDEVLLIAQIETADGLESVEQIAAVEGIDVLWIGQSDLTNSLGIPGDFAHREFQRALDRVVEACRTNQKAAGYMTLTVDDGRAFLDRGFRCLAYGGDLWLYQRALSEGIAGLRVASGK
jgi:2-dehydro-3-deoxyglucarate aldolase/4-hydroxy-2-oxoheptanedioate aldolase